MTTTIRDFRDIPSGLQELQSIRPRDIQSNYPYGIQSNYFYDIQSNYFYDSIAGTTYHQRAVAAIERALCDGFERPDFESLVDDVYEIYASIMTRDEFDELNLGIDKVIIPALSAFINDRDPAATGRHLLYSIYVNNNDDNDNPHLTLKVAAKNTEQLIAINECENDGVFNFDKVGEMIQCVHTSKTLVEYNVDESVSKLFDDHQFTISISNWIDYKVRKHFEDCGIIVCCLESLN